MGRGHFEPFGRYRELAIFSLVLRYPVRRVFDRAQFEVPVRTHWLARDRDGPERSPVASTTRRKAANRATERGAIAVEFALVLPILLALLMGIITAGLSYNNLLGSADAVREGARFGATTLDSGTWADSVRDRTVEQSYNTLTSGQVCVELVKAPAPGTVLRASTGCALPAAARPATPAAALAGSCVVKVWMQSPFNINGVVYSFTVDATRQSVALYERTC